MEAAAHGRQILISNATRDLAAPELPEDITCHDLGLHRLKGVGEDRLWHVLHPGLPTDFPPIVTLNPQRHNLPLPLTPFIGRDRQIEEWLELLRKPTTRLLTLVGFGGMGKTRSALQLAEHCVDDFDAGVWWVELEEVREVEATMQTIAHQLHLHVDPERAVKKQLHDFLRGRKMLLVLDNTEQIPEAAIVVHELLGAAPGVKCIVTSRRALELQTEQQMEVTPLPRGDAEALFVERARARHPHFAITTENAADVAELCRHLEGVPLTIELAASRVVGMTPREMLDRLDERFRMLQSRAPDLRPRQRALRAAIDWSYELLSEDERLLFSQLSVFAGGFEMRDAEAVCSRPELEPKGEAGDVFEAVMELRRHSFLQAETDAVAQRTRYSMLESVRSYAGERLQGCADGGTQARQRHAEYFLQFAQERVARFRMRDEVRAVGELEASFDNLRAASAHAEETGRSKLCARLALALGMALQRCGFVPEAMRRILAGLEALTQLPEPEVALRAELLRECAGLHCDQLEWEEAIQRALEARALYEEMMSLNGMAQANNILGIAARRQQKFNEARDYLALALEQYQRAGHEMGVGIVNNNLGLVLDDEQGDKETAARHFREYLRLSEKHGDDRGVTEAATNLGVLSQAQGKLDEARQYYQRALGLDQRLRDSLGVARALTNLGEVAEAQGEIEQAGRLFSAAVHLFNRMGSPYEKYASDCLQRAGSSLNLSTEPNSLRQQLKDKSLDDLVNWALAKV